MRLLPHWYQSIEDARILITHCTHCLACPCVFARMCPYLSTSLQAELIRPGMFFAGSNQIGVLFSLTCSISDVLERKEKGCLTFRAWSIHQLNRVTWRHVVVANLGEYASLPTSMGNFSPISHISFVWTRAARCAEHEVKTYARCIKAAAMFEEAVFPSWSQHSIALATVTFGLALHSLPCCMATRRNKAQSAARAYDGVQHV